MSTTAIIGFHTPAAAFLSNFYEHPFTYRGVWWRCAEAPYQAEKEVFRSWADVVEEFHRYNGPTAKREGRSLRCRADWNMVRLEVMRAVLDAKFAEPTLRTKLLATGDAHLEEANTWRDVFWGTYNGFGQNHLGRLLMEIRDGARA